MNDSVVVARLHLGAHVAAFLASLRGIDCNENTVALPALQSSNLPRGGIGLGAEIEDFEQSLNSSRARVVGIIRARVRGGEAYTAAELAELNARRSSLAVFAPYE